jgi:YD repeat-containing protein
VEQGKRKNGEGSIFQGNLVSLTDAKNQVTQFTYDALGHKLKELRPLGNSLEYLYDPAGRLLVCADSMGRQVSYLYNTTTGRLDNYFLRKDPNHLSGDIVRFSYDNQGNLAGYDDGVAKAHYDYDKLGR